MRYEVIDSVNGAILGVFDNRKDAVKALSGDLRLVVVDDDGVRSEDAGE